MARYLIGLLVLFSLPSLSIGEIENASLKWDELPALPNELGVAGPIVGVHDYPREGPTKSTLIVAGGANFPDPDWSSAKQWHDDVYLLTRDLTSPKSALQWTTAGKLPKSLAYSATVSTPYGVFSMGGNDSSTTFDDVFAIQTDGKTVTIVEYPKLPKPCVYGDAAYLDGAIYLAGGQSSSDPSSAMANFWKLEIDLESPMDSKWVELAGWDAEPRAHNLCVAQNNGYHDAIFIFSGRRQTGPDEATNTTFFNDMWEYTPRTNSWRKRADLPQCVMAGTAIKYRQSNIFVFGGDDGEFFGRAAELKDTHPGFPKKSFSYNAITDAWAEFGATPANHVTTKAVSFDGKIVIPSGEVRPRVRSPKVWGISPTSNQRSFGMINYAVLFGYLAAMVGVGVYFARKNKSTDDYFRGGKRIPWWAAGCSIYATMLSSLTYTGLPSKSFAQDWVLAVLNFMIPVVAFVAVFVALPFYRRIDATSAYEYLERRFNRSVRLFGSVSFTLYHLFRMAVVMSLTGLALSVATPLTGTQSVLIIGILSIIYCTMGGIEAVIWTDTIQTVVLLGGALLALGLLMQGIDGGWQEFMDVGRAANKFKMANFNWDITSANVAIWFIIIGSIAQNVSTYTADQAVVQRYMTTETQRQAAKSIWTNAVLSIPTTFLFFGIGTALFVFYRANPDKLDPTLQTDQMFPLFIAREMPIGLAGLIVAGIFAAAQSTVSTSMNSTATTIVTDFVRPFASSLSEANYLRIAQILTLLFGVIGTLVGLFFLDENIKSLFDAFIGVIGMFMGVLGGLFVLGALTRRANGKGAIVGAIVGAVVMLTLFRYKLVTVYMYTFCGIGSCFITGYLASLLFPEEQTKDLAGLTVYTLEATGSNV